jgi:peptide/nickel transport system substrate-binding protein
MRFLGRRLLAMLPALAGVVVCTFVLTQFLEAIQQRNVPAFIGKWTSFVNDPGYHLGLLLTTGASSNYGNYSNPAVDAEIKQAATEPDVATRNTLYAQAQKQITEDAPWLYLYEYNRVVGLHTGVSGYTFYPDEILRFAGMSK